MTDRELLEAAAEAAGMNDAEYQDMGGWGEVRHGMKEGMFSTTLYDETGRGYWNPLESNGDAFRLAVKLGAMIDQQAEGVFVCINSAGAYASEPYSDDKYADTRRAIVRAAAALTRKESKE